MSKSLSETLNSASSKKSGAREPVRARGQVDGRPTLGSRAER